MANTDVTNYDAMGRICQLDQLVHGQDGVVWFSDGIRSAAAVRKH